MLMLSKPNIYTYRKYRAKLYRLKRVVFMSPAESRYVEVMGGRVKRCHWLRNRLGFPAVLVVDRGPLFRAERVRREKRIGKYFVDFGNDIGRCIEIDGNTYHMDIVADLHRDSYLIERGQRVLRIKAYDVFRNPKLVQDKTRAFLINGRT